MARQERFIPSFVRGSDDYHEYFCQPCSDDGKHLEAKGYCSDCMEFLCEECYEFHTKPRALRHHVLIDRNGMQQISPPSSVLVRNRDTCRHHARKAIDYFCNTHEDFACSTCLLEDHKRCKKVICISDQLDGIARSNEYMKLIKDLKRLDKQAGSILTRANRNAERVNMMFEEALQDEQQFRKNVDKILDDLAQTSTDEAENIHRDDKANIKSVIDGVTETHKKIQNLQGELVGLENDNKLFQLFVAMKKAKYWMERFKSTLKDSESDIGVTEYKFIPDENITERLTQYNELGLICLDSDHNQDLSTTCEEKQVCAPTSATPAAHILTLEPSNRMASHLVDIDVRTKGELVAHPDGIISVSEKLIVIDSGNCKVKLVDVEPIAEFKTDAPPCDITEIKSGQVAVTIASKWCILLLKVTDKLSKNKEIKTRGECYGISYSDDKMYVTYKNSPTVDVLDRSGNILHKIEMDRYERPLFLDPRFVSVGKDSQVLYVSDHGYNYVICVTTSGTVLGVYEDDDLDQPSQITVDKYGAVLICGHGSDNIHVISSSCKKIAVLLDEDDGIKIPTALCCSKDSNKLYVGVADVVSVFKIERDN